MSEHAILAIAGIGLIGALCQWTAWKLRVPAILFLLVAGILLGPVSGWLKPDILMGNLLFPFISLAVAIILFEGSLTLKFDEIQGLERVVRRFVTSGALVTWGITLLAAHYLVGLSWEMATLFGAIMVVTGPTVIMPLLRTVRPTAKVANILRWEGIVIDPIGALLAVLVFEFIISQESGGALGQTLFIFFRLLIGGISIGIAGGYLLGEALRRDWLPGYQLNLVALAAVIGVFAASNMVAEESGLLAVTIMGIYLANKKGVPIDEILSFKESLSLVLITVLFILLAARLDLARLHHLGWAAVQAFLIVQFVARPLEVLYATFGSSLNWRERALLCWIAPRGIVAAAVTSLFALQLDQRGFTEAQVLVPLTFVVIIGTVILQSLTAGPLARLLKVSEPSAGGFLIIGANPLARAIASALQQQKITVLLTDEHWTNVSRARMAGLPTYYGNPLSEHAELFMNPSGLGRLLALTDDAYFNELACTRYRDDFGAKGVYALRVGLPGKGRKQPAGHGQQIFGKNGNYAELIRRIHLGAEIKRTLLTETYSLDTFHKAYGERAEPLFAIDAKGRAEVFHANYSGQPGPGWSIIALIDPSPGTAGNSVRKKKPEAEAIAAPSVPSAPPAPPRDAV